MPKSKTTKTAKPGKQSALKWGLIAVVVAIALIAGTWFAASQFQSTAQREAAAGAPEAAPVHATVTRGDLRDEISVKATIGEQNATTVSFAVSNEGTVVVTEIGAEATVGKQLENGSILLWADDRPVFLLDGAFPAYRDLKLGDSGRDVTQLQNALVAMGYELGVDGDFGQGTLNALIDMYRVEGSEMPKTQVAGSAGADKPQSGEKKTTTAKSEYVLPQAEICFVPTIGVARLNEMPPVGTILDGSNANIKVSNSELKLSAEVPGNVAAELSKGLAAQISVDNQPFDLIITEIKPIEEEKTEAAGGDQQTAGNSLITFQPNKGNLPENLSYDQEILVIVARTKTIENSLLIPKRAITASPDGKTTVLKLDIDGQYVPIEVEELSCITGECAIKNDSGEINEGDQIRVDPL